MRKEEFEAVHSSATATTAVVAASSSSSSASPSQSSPSRYVPSAPTAQLQFFVRMISDSKTLVIQASPRDLVKCIHDKIQMLAGIPLCEQRLIYRGKQLRWEQSLARCGIENDASLQLVGRMRSTSRPKSWQIMNDMISIICRLSQGETVPNALKTIKTHLSECLSGTPKGSFSTARKHLQLLMSFSAPTALVILYMSPVKGNRKIAEKSIKHFLCLTKTTLPKHCHSICVPIVMKFCELLRGVPQYKKLYTSCWTCLSSLLETIGLLQTSKGFDWVARLTLVKGIFPFVSGLAHRLCRVLDSNIESAVDMGLLRTDVNDFTVFLPYIYNAIREHPRLECPISTPLPKKASYDLKFVQVVGDLYDIFESMLVKMNLCLIGMEKHLASNSTGEGDVFYQQSSQYLALLKELNAISKLYMGCQERFRTMLRLRHRSLCTLILRYVKQTDDSWWLLEHKDVIDFEAKRHMVMMLFPEVVEDFEELHKILIDRSQLLAESFNFVSEANPESLHGSLFVQFKNEEATGLGVRREWFYLVCRAIFNQQNALFIACPNDCSRFYPNPASKVDPLSLKHFKFAGRMIALALRCKVQVGIVLDRIFFLQLAGLQVSLEDTREADPCLYSSCRKILEMDPDFIDSDALGLTFVREVEELGSRKVIELLPGGANLVVNS